RACRRRLAIAAIDDARATRNAGVVILAVVAGRQIAVLRGRCPGHQDTRDDETACDGRGHLDRYKAYQILFRGHPADLPCPASACSGKVHAGLPIRTCAKYRPPEHIPIPTERDVL